MFFENLQTHFGGPLTEDDWVDIRNHEKKQPEGFYHTMRFPDGSGWKGFYDVEKMLPSFHLPESFSGKTVLDIGPADGFFSFYAEQKKAQKVLAMQPGPPMPGFAYAHRKLCSNIIFCRKNIYDLNDITGDEDRFDYVFCFTVLLHLPEIFSAIKAIFNATNEVAYISTLTDEQSDQGDIAGKPYVLFNAHKTSLGSYRFWIPNTLAFTRMAEFAGFQKVEVLDHFDYTPERANARSSYTTVIRCEKNG